MEAADADIAHAVADNPFLHADQHIGAGRQLEGGGLAVAGHGDQHLGGVLQLGLDGGEIFLLYLRAVHGRDDVPLAHAGLLGGRILMNQRGNDFPFRGQGDVDADAGHLAFRLRLRLGIGVMAEIGGVRVVNTGDIRLGQSRAQLGLVNVRVLLAHGCVHIRNVVKHALFLGQGRDVGVEIPHGHHHGDRNGQRHGDDDQRQSGSQRNFFIHRGIPFLRFLPAPARRRRGRPYCRNKLMKTPAMPASS